MWAMEPGSRPQWKKQWLGPWPSRNPAPRFGRERVASTPKAFPSPSYIGRNPTGSSLWRSLISRGVLVIGARDEETGAEAGRTVRTPVAIPYCSRACHTPSPNVELSAHGVAGAGLWVPTRSRNYRGKASAKVSAQGKYKGCEAGRGLGAGYGAR